MADGLEEEIIIIEDSDAAYDSGVSKQPAIEDSSSSSKQKLLIIALGVAIVSVLLILGIFKGISKEPQKISTQNIQEKLQEKRSESVEPSKLEEMIAKANYLYSSGSKEQALSLYEKIAQYSQAVSAYNLGVAQLKDAQYETALSTFQKAIQNNEKICVSAINAAVCSLYLKNEESFRYYIDLAHAYLPQERSSPLYSYYYALINYYRDNYFEALSALKNPTSQEYQKIQNNLSAKINALFENDYTAIESIEKNENPMDAFSLGLLYARVGDLTLAKTHLQEAIKNNIEPMRAQLALGYINIKSGQLQEAAKEIENITDMFGEEVYKPYPVKIELKESLFDPNKAQERYNNIINKNREVTYQKIFYFSPYKIFNANQTISYIRKGTANIYIDNIASAQEYLQRSASSSKVNLGMIEAIKKALSFRLREANEILQKLVELQPKHSILHYNLALTYAQMGNMPDAAKHFLRSYNLDAKNYLSGIYAIMSSQLNDKENPKLLSIIKDSISHEEFNEEIDLYKNLIFISEDNYISTLEWLERDYQQRPLYLAMDVIIALRQNNIQAAQKAAAKLTIMLPNDIVPHMLYIDAYFSRFGTKEYAKEVMNYLKKQSFKFDDLYFGAHITRYLYIQQNLITGRLYFLREQLKEVMESTTERKEEIVGTLALASLYDGAFEESYTLYNSLIDDFKIRDAHTLYLGAIASIAAKHNANAIALLELSKMKNPNFLESRYALGLLYLETKNNKGAVIQFLKINKNNFSSDYFNFDIDIKKLIFEKSQTKT